MSGDDLLKNNMKGSNSMLIKILSHHLPKGTGKETAKHLRKVITSDKGKFNILLLHKQTVSKYVRTQFLKVVQFRMQTLTELMGKNGHRLRYIQMVIILNFNSSSINMPHLMTNHKMCFLVYSNISLNSQHTQ